MYVWDGMATMLTEELREQGIYRVKAKSTKAQTSEEEEREDVWVHRVWY